MDMSDMAMAGHPPSIPHAFAVVGTAWWIVTSLNIESGENLSVAPAN